MSERGNERVNFYINGAVITACRNVGLLINGGRMSPKLRQPRKLYVIMAYFPLRMYKLYQSAMLSTAQGKNL